MLVAAAVATLLITALKTRFGSIDYSDFVFFLVIFTVTAHFDLRLTGGGKMNVGIALTLAALVALPGVEVVWMFLIGTLVTLVTRMIGETEKDELLGLLIDFSGVGLTALVFWLLVELLPKKPLLLGRYTPGVLISVAIAAGVLFLFYVVRETYISSKEGLFPVLVYSQSIARKSWIPFLILSFVGVLMGLIFLGIGMWSVLIALPLLLVFIYAYNKVAVTDEYLLETIKVLSAIPEETGMIDLGHADRVARLSEAVSRELGLGPEDVQQVEFAAYLHEMGAISGPGEPEGDQEQLTGVEGFTAGGVDIAGKVNYLEVAAEILRGREGLRDRVSDIDKRRAASLGAGILEAVDDFEALLKGSEDREPMTESEALTEMNLERGVKYDSKVLRAIARVLPRIRREGLTSSAEGSTESSPFWGEQEG